MFHFWHQWDGHTDPEYYPTPQCVVCDTPYRWWRWGGQYRGIPAVAYQRREPGE